jgi:hypothetical protein
VIDLDAEKSKLKLDIERIGNTLGLDGFRIKESKENGASTLISPKFYNKGVYRVQNTDNGRLENMAVNIDKVAAVTYNGLVEELGKDCVDINLWKDVPEGGAIFFYSLKVEKDFVK